MEIPPVVKNNWPYIVGGVLGVGVLIYMSRGSSGGGSAGYVQVPDNTAANQSYALAKSAQDAQFAIKDKELNVLAMQAQGQTFAAVAGAAGGLVQSLNAPTVAALNASAAENVATVQGAVANSIAGYTAQGSIIQSTAAASGTYADALARQSAALSNAVSASQNAIGQQSVAVAQGQARSDASADAANANRNNNRAQMGMAALAAFSDERVKLNIDATARDSVSDIQKLSFVQFDYDESKVGPQLVPHFDVGVLAGEAEVINPNWVVEIDGIKQIVLPTMLMSALHAVNQLTERIAQLESANG